MTTRWYHYFNKKGEENLINNESIEEEDLLICQQLQYRRYTKFKNFSEFSRFYLGVEEHERCFYEMMREENGRKPYFDIDIDDISFDYEKMIEEIKNTLINMIGKKIKILVFDSSTDNKLSFHIIVDDVYLQSYKELLNFYDKVEEKLSEKNKKYMDRSVYKSVQQFRITGSHKYMRFNTKKIREDLSYRFAIPRRIKTEIGKYNYLLSSSLVTNVSSCRILCGFHVSKEENKIISSGSANEGDIEDVMKLFYNKYSYGDFSFQECKEKNGNLLIVLRRLNPTYCEICERVHESENPFITVVGDFRNITFYCRRNEIKEKKEGINIGSLGIPDYTDVLKLEPPIISEEFVENKKEVEKEEVSVQENLEQVLEDISCDVPVLYKSNKKRDLSKTLDQINLGNFLY